MLLNVVGWIAVVLGVLGIFLPLLPTTPFLLLASACFMRSNEKFHHWIMHHPHLGPIIDNWNQHRAVTSAVKKRGYVLLAISFMFSFFMMPIWWMKIGIVFGFIVLFFCFSRMAVYDPSLEEAIQKESTPKEPAPKVAEFNENH
ncbi:MAG: YbaN family protein [Vibrio sp.]